MEFHITTVVSTLNTVRVGSSQKTVKKNPNVALSLDVHLVDELIGC